MTHQPPRAGTCRQGADRTPGLPGQSPQWLRKQPQKNGLPVLPRGFTLIELMVTLALAAVLASLAAPSVRDFVVRSRLTHVGNEFMTSVLKARNEAVNRNTCVTLCRSSNAGDASAACTATAAAGADWQVGWIAFLNPDCDSSRNAPDGAINMLLARPAASTDYLLQAQASRQKMTFNARGAPALTEVDQFNLIYRNVGNPLTQKYAFNICMDGLGRTRTLPPNGTCAADQ